MFSVKSSRASASLDRSGLSGRGNSFAPGSVRTPMTQPVYGQGSLPHSIQMRMAEPEEIAATACFLLSDESSYFTGALLVPDGGATAV